MFGGRCQEALKPKPETRHQTLEYSIDVGIVSILGSIRETPYRGLFSTYPLKATYGSLKRDLIEKVYIAKGPPNPNCYGSRIAFWCIHLRAIVCQNKNPRGLGFRVKVLVP